MTPTLDNFGVTTSTILRAPTTDSQGEFICPECGFAITRTFGPVRVHHPDVPAESGVRVPDTVPTFGYRCTNHSNKLVMPAPPSHDRVPTEGWTEVPLRLADGREWAMVAPEREVSHV